MSEAALLRKGRIQRMDDFRESVALIVPILCQVFWGLTYFLEIQVETAAASDKPVDMEISIEPNAQTGKPTEVQQPAGAML